MDDMQIISLYNLRDERAIFETYKKYGSDCIKAAKRILENQQDVEECINDAMVGAWNAIPPQCPTNLRAFLVAVTRNLALNRLKYEKRFKRGDGQIPLLLDELSYCIRDEEDIETTVDERMKVQSIEKFLDSLSSDARTIFVQRYIAFLSIKEIADKYDITESKVKVTLMRVRKQLRKYLKQEDLI